jgi:hypothetical protein
VVIIGYSLTPIVARGGKVIKIIVSFIAVLMFANGVLHLSFSLYFSTWVPGVTSSPLLLFASVYLLVRLGRGQRKSPLIA